ncbi:heterokaryon incompatibility protein-domain-containing protein [Xylaria digitata]|nr:heterokaryon incompatibility protein-domain-containing protein [Xylaria digitata]
MIPATIDIKLLEYWLRECDKKHSHPVVPSTPRTRMQSIMSRGLFRLINTSTGSVETMTSLSKYVALSYVWGKADQPNYQPLESKPISDHAPTIRDAAIIAKSVGFQWIWVDRICIDQTNESEKAILIPYMKDIFAVAQLTIVAACGDSAQSGLLGSPKTPRRAERPLVSISSVSLLHVALSINHLLEKSVWGQRGWTYEEYVFSRRLLFFLSSEVLFNCGQYIFRESMGRRPIVEKQDEIERGIFGQHTWCNTTRLHKSLQNEPANMAGVLNINNFVRALEEYTNRHLTVESDRVAAIAGVIVAAMEDPMDEISERILLRHGHPLRFFEALLTWKSFLPERNASPKPFAPSWSWASSPDQVKFTPIRNRVLMFPDNCWFQYSLLHNHDILGLPTNDNSVACSLGLQPPDGLIADQPWMRSQFGGLSLSHETGPLADLGLPRLHMVALVFDARFVCGQGREEEQHILAALGSTESGYDIYKKPGVSWDMYDNWSIYPEYQPRYFPERNGSEPQPFETFAIITGRPWYSEPRTGQGPFERFYDLHVMLLEKTGRHDTYTRVGVALIRHVNEGNYFFKVFSKGRPRWQYICIV